MKNKNKIISIVIFLSVFMMLVSCVKQKAEWKGIIEEVDGVTVVKNPKEPMYGEEVCSLEEELSFGEAEESEEYMFSQIRGIAVDDEEKIYVLDVREAHIKVFDKNGDYIMTIGREGQGPGEMAVPLDIQITSKDEIVVNCPMSSRLVFYNLLGEFLREVRLTKIPRSLLTMDSNDDFICSYPKGIQPFKVVLEKFSSEQKPLFSLVEIEPDYSNVYSLFAPGIVFGVTKENNIIWAVTNKYELNINNSEGKLTRRILKDYDPIEIMEEEKKNIIENAAPRPGQKIPKNYPPLLPVFISIDEEGRIFVGTYAKAEEGKGYYYDVFNLEGKYITKVCLNSLLLRSSNIWKKEKLYTIEEDEEGYQVVKRYKVTWKY